MAKLTRILLVEDKPLIAMLYEDIVEQTPFEIIDVLMCNQDALKAIETQRPDVVIVDCNLTDGPCLPIVRKLQEKGIPFIVATGYGENVDPKLGNARWLTKPVRDQDVLDALQEVMSVR